MKQSPENKTTPPDVEQFHRDGYFIQRGAVPAQALGPLQAAIEECRRNPSEHHAILGQVDDAIFDSDLFRWRDQPEIAELAQSSPLVTQAERLLGGSVLFVEDQWFSADPASATGSPWHQDGPYYEIDRPFATCWIPLEDVAAAHALHVVPSSHVDGTQMAAVAFDTAGTTIQPAPNQPAASQPTASRVAADLGDAVGFDMQAGDALWFHSGTAHGVPTPAATGGRRFSLRYAPIDARRQTRSHTVAAFWSTLPHGLADGDPLKTSPWFPALSVHEELPIERLNLE